MANIVTAARNYPVQRHHRPCGASAKSISALAFRDRVCFSRCGGSQSAEFPSACNEAFGVRLLQLSICLIQLSIHIGSTHLAGPPVSARQAADIRDQ